MFDTEKEFEDALVFDLSHNRGWEKVILNYPTEEDLLQNWADILSHNNQERDRLDKYPLTMGEMTQILEQVKNLRTPLKLNQFINGKSVTITRDNPEHKEKFGKEVTLKIYDRNEIVAGKSRYQIARQPKFKAKGLFPDRRGDLMLLINGMPVFHLELKRSGVPVTEACNQIEKYAHENIFTGIFSLVQVFVAMNPEETLYFANPGPDGKFNPDYYFHWADFNNEPINEWQKIASSLLFIPMAHQMIGFYTVADESDGVLKVMRSYQYYAANAISDTVSKNDWRGQQRGGFIWHTTGSGKTLTSFKSAQLIANSRDADKVVFLTDRVDLGTQSLREYRAFADEREEVQATENTHVLISKLKSNDPADTLIVSSIQKMSIIADENVNDDDIAKINEKRLVFIVDECHRSTFGDMMYNIKKTFPNALLFGFTGTPTFEENQKKMSTTATVFGNELHRYVLADGIRDKNVLGFDTYMVRTFKDNDIREKIALEKAKCETAADALSDEKTAEIYQNYMYKVQMSGYTDDNGKYVKGIEDYIPSVQYITEEHQNKVVEDITTEFLRLSFGGKYHALFATSSIPEAIDYYRLLKNAAPNLKITCLFDPNISNEDGQYKTEYKGQKAALFKEDGLVEILKDYNERYGTNFSMATHASFKRDLCNRLAHKSPYIRVPQDQQLDMVIVVDQLLTGYDSKYINALFMDKILEYDALIQAFSRTNRLFGHEKQFGVIRYYRKPYTMKSHIEQAVKLYSGDKPTQLFVQKITENIHQMNEVYTEITELFTCANVPDLDALPPMPEERAKFAQLFKKLNDYLDAARIQGFSWEQSEYSIEDETTGEVKTEKIIFGENEYNVLLTRYKELAKPQTDNTNNAGETAPYELAGYLIEMNTGKIDNDYMNSRFEKYLRALDSGDEKSKSDAAAELQKSFAVLPIERQKLANIFLHDIQNGTAVLEVGKTIIDYINEYQSRKFYDQTQTFAETFGINAELLREIIQSSPTAQTINDYGKLDRLKQTVDKEKARAYFEKKEGTVVLPHKVNPKFDKVLRDFILNGGRDLN